MMKNISKKLFFGLLMAVCMMGMTNSYAQNTYTISVSANPSAGGSTTGGGTTFHYNDQCTVTATPAESYHFLRWTENGTPVSTDASYTFTVTGARTLVAQFQLKSYDISVSANPTNGGTVSGGGTYDHFETCTVTAVPAPGYHFVNWTENGTQVSTNASYEFTVTSARNLVAQFEINSYDISVSANPTNGGTVSGGGNFNHFASCTVIATPGTGYEFLRWTENGTQVSTDANYTFTVTGARTLVAHFQLIDYTISVSPSPSAGGNVSGGGTTFHYNNPCTVTATPNTGYHFYRWTENGQEASTDNPYSFTVTGNRNLVAQFQLNSYNISVSANPANSGSVNGGGNFNHFETCTVTAVPATGYHFVNWTEGGTPVSTNASYEFTVTGNRNLVAHFAIQSQTYTINATSDPEGSGTITGTGTYIPGQQCSLHASAAIGYQFVNWTENGTVVSTSTTYNFTVTSNRTFVAHFNLYNYSVSVSANPQNGGTVSGGGNGFHYGDDCTVTATPSTGYQFVNWKENGTVVSTSASYSFTVTGNRNLVAHFAIQSQTYTINATSDPEGSGTITGTGTYIPGQQCSLHASAAIGYQFANWTENGTVISEGNTNYEFTVTGNRNLVAHFNLSNYTVAISVNPENGGTVSGGGNGFHHGDECTVTATPNPGYTFQKWTKNGTQVSTNPSYTFTVTGNTNLQAHFIPETYTVSVSANPTNGGTVTGGGSNLSYGSSCTPTATPATGYTFVNWTKDGVQVSASNPYTFSVTSSGTYVAHFSTASYVVTLNPDPANGGTVSGGGGYNHGQSCTVVATANAGYQFVNWTRNGTVVSTSASYTFQVTGNTTLVAHFQQINYTINVSANPSAGGTVSAGGNTYHYGDNCTVTATPSTGYQFVNWKENGTVVSTSASYTFTVTGNRTLVAQFQLNTYTISVSANPSNGGMVAGGGTIGYGQECMVMASPNPGYTFQGWTENGTTVSEATEYTFTVTGNRNLVAQFEAQTCTVSVEADPSEGGTVYVGNTPGTIQASIIQGETCEVHAIANEEGYRFTHWSKNGAPVTDLSTYSFTVMEDVTLVAHFLQQYTIEVEASPENGGTVAGGGIYDQGYYCTVSATAASGYTFYEWRENEQHVSYDANYTFTVTSDRTLVAIFQELGENEFNINVSASPSSGGIVTGDGSYQQGQMCIVTATPNPGWSFKNWTENGAEVETAMNYTFTVTNNRSLVANFQPKGYIITLVRDPEEGGTVIGGGQYFAGSYVTIHALPNIGYEFKNWTKDGIVIGTSPDCSFQVTEDATYVAHFEQIPQYTVDVEIEPMGGGQVVGSGQYIYGAQCTLEAIANEEYSFVCWKLNGAVLTFERILTFPVTSDITFTAVFIENESPNEYYTITALAGGHGTITPQGNVAVLQGTDQSFTMTPEAGGRIANVLVDGIEIGPVESYTFRNVNRDHNIYVAFSGVGVEETPMAEVEIYPNPAKDKVHIKGEGIETVTLYDLLGNVLIDVDYDKGKELNVSKLSSGTYVLMLTAQNGNKRYQKLVVTK